ncbi:MAG: hypothetical protein ACTS5F_01090 [Candidatus Hodgkinia cicadicola]
MLRSPFLRSSFISLSFLRIVMRNDCNNYKTNYSEVIGETEERSITFRC